MPGRPGPGPGSGGDPLLKTLLLLALASSAPAASRVSCGIKLGGGAAAFSAQPRPQAAPNPANLFALLATQTTLTSEPGLALALGFWAGLDLAKLLSLQAELLGTARNSGVIEDIGFGIRRGRSFQRTSAEAALTARLAWEFGGGQGRVKIRPFALAGAFGNRTLSLRQDMGLVGESAANVPWKDAPNEDWGWCAGPGLELRGGRFGQVAFELRWHEGQKDLDPGGPLVLKDRGLDFFLSFGF